MKRTNKIFLLLLLGIIIALLAVNVFGEDRFPKPEFETSHQQPLTTTPQPASQFFDYLDIFLLVIGMGFASYFSLKKRSRNGIFIISILSVLYFGFYRHGCVCSVGSVQNFALALGNSGYVLPVLVGAFFILPLLFSLFFARSFCSSVCPLGAIQDLLVLKPLKVPSSLSKVLSLLPYLYLGFAVLFAFTNSGFIICRYDPFINIFRLSASFNIIIYSGAFLVLSILIARPYCRFLCPYGVLLGWMSWLSPRQVSITPKECIQCKLCEDSCPFDAIVKPSPEKVPETRAEGSRRIGFLLLLIPFLMIISGFAISRLDTVLSRVNPVVRLAEQVKLEDEGIVKETTLESRTFRSQDKTTEQLIIESQNIVRQFRIGGWILGGFLALAFSLKLFNLSIRRKQEDYIPDPVNCYSCARCFESCPIEHETRKSILQVDNYDSTS